MVFNFDLQKALHVDYIQPLQQLKIEDVQDSESVLHKPEEPTSLEIKNNPSFDPKLNSDNTFDQDTMKQVREMLSEAKGETEMDQASNIIAAESQLKQGNILAAEYFLKQSNRKLRVDEIDKKGLTIDRRNLPNQFEKDLDYLRLADLYSRILRYIIKAEERYDKSTPTEKQQYEVLKNSLRRIETTLYQHFGLQPEGISTSFTIGHQNTPNIMKRKLEYANMLLELYNRGRDTKRMKLDEESLVNQELKEPEVREPEPVENFEYNPKPRPRKRKAKILINQEAKELEQEPLENLEYKPKKRKVRKRLYTSTKKKTTISKQSESLPTIESPPELSQGSKKDLLSQIRAGIQLKKTPVKNTKTSGSLLDEIRTRIGRRRNFIEEDDDEKLSGSGLKYNYKPRHKKSEMEKKLNWLVLGDWLISKRDLGEGILNCRYRKNFHVTTGFPRTELSPVLALIISSLISKQYPSASQLSQLNESEIQFLQKLIQRTRIDFVLPPQF